MSSNLITQPYGIILDPTGGGGRAKPVANGKCYVGIIDLDPVANPRTDLAYKDESGTERSLTSPLILNNSGAFVVSENDGTLIQPYIKNGVGHSVLITDKRGTPVYSDNHVGDPGNIKPALDEFFPELVPKYTDIVYKASGGNSAVENMISGVPVAASVGDTCSTGSMSWKRVAETSPSVISDFSPITNYYVNDFGVDNSGSSDVRSSLQFVNDSLPSTGAAVVFNGEYLIDATGESPTINNPVRGMLVEKDNIKFIAYGSKFRMVGIPKSYLISIDDLGSSGRDIFTFFTFLRNEGCEFYGGDFYGENTDDTVFRYQSPRAKGIGAIGTGSLKVMHASFHSILGNGVNATPSDSTIDGQYKECRGVKATSCSSDNSWEGAINYMGNTFDCSISDCDLTNSGNGFEGASDGLVVSGNRMIGNNNGCSISGKNFSVTGNTIDSKATLGSIGIIISSSASAMVQNGVVSGNQISNFERFGLTVYPTASKILFSGNYFESEEQTDPLSICINVTGTPSNSIDDLEFSGNTVRTNSNWGLSAGYTNNLNILSNSFYGANQQSILAQAGNTEIRVLGNICDNSIALSGGTSYGQSNITPTSTREFYQFVAIGAIPKRAGLTWRVGDRVLNTATYAGYDWGFVCKTAGVDGTAAFSSLGLVS